MSIRGFETSTHPVNLYLTDEIGTALNNVGPGPHAVDGAAPGTEVWEAGILVQVNNIRYFIPWRGIRAITQQQDAQEPGTDPIPGGGFAKKR